VLLRYDGLVKTLYGGEIMSANNKIELTAVIKVLQALTKSLTW
jgi:ribonuclease HI